MDPQRLRLLVADDDALLREALAEVLACDGHDVVQAADGQQALDRLDEGFQPCAILLDWAMPVADGEAFLTARAASGPFSSIPVFVLSASHRPIDDHRIQGFLEKPFRIEELLGMLRKVCHGHCVSRTCPVAPGSRELSARNAPSRPDDSPSAPRIR